MNNPYKKSALLWGITASGSLLTFYFILMSAFSSFSDALGQYLQLWLWMSLLVIGFGVQVGLYGHIRITAREHTERGQKAAVAASSGLSTTSMVACCAHHLTDVLPILGVSALSLFLNRYQFLFLVIGLLSNAIGIAFMVLKIQEHSIYDENDAFIRRIMKFPLRFIFFIVVGISALIFLSVLYASIGGFT